MAIREDMGLLAYAPLGAGALTGKYLGGARPPGSRWAVFDQAMRYDKPNGHLATARYVSLAARLGYEPAHLAIAFVLAQPFVTAAIIGATSLQQLQTDLGAADITLSDAAMAAINEIHDDIPNPCP